MFQMMLKRILMASSQKPQLKSLCAACFGGAANLSIRNSFFSHFLFQDLLH